MNELKNSAPKLSKIKKEQPFTTPDNYFVDFSSRLQGKIQAEKSSNLPKKNKVIPLLKPAIGLAASFILVMMLVYWPLKSFLPDYLAKTVTPGEIETETSEEEKYIYIMEKVDETAFFTLIEDTPDEESLNDEELINYLSANISDYEIFLETDY